MSLTLVRALAVRENVIRVTFSEVPYYSGLFDPGDASRVEYFTVSPVEGTFGADGDPARLVYAARPDLVSSDPLSIDVVLDRPMSPYPARYDVAVEGLIGNDARDALSPTSQTLEVEAVYRELVIPSVESPPEPVDFAPGLAPDGRDIASQGAMPSLKERLLRRCLTIPGSFAHLPGYGLGLGSYGKKLMVPATRLRLAADAERQALLEPEVTSAKVTSSVDTQKTGLVRFTFLVRTRFAAKAQKFEAEVQT